jgi:hypothetical protein
VDQGERLLHGSSFGAAAAAYAEHRPDYAQVAVRWALEPAPGPRVLDLGAGTGKLTGTLVALGAEAGVHRVYLASYLFGPVRGVRAVLDVPRGQGEKFAVATLQFESGALGVIEAHYYGPPWTFDDETEIIGTDAILRLAGSESLYGGYRGGPALTMFRDGQWSEVPVPDDDWRSSVEASVIAYLDAVTADREPPVTGADGLETVRLIHQIYDSATILDAGTGFIRHHHRANRPNDVRPA